MTKKIIKIASVLLIAVIVLGTFAACTSKPQSEQLVAKWQDSAGVSGFEFNEDGAVTLTYINVVIPVLEIPFNGTITGAYETKEVEEDNEKKNIVTIKFTLFGKSVEFSYEYEVKKSVLTLINPEDGEKTTYIKCVEKTNSTTEKNADSKSTDEGTQK